jgi:hypothetical protein
MVQGAPQTAGRFDAGIRMYKAPPPEVSTEQFYETDPARDFQRGFSIQTDSPLPVTWAEHVAAQVTGAGLQKYMSDYVHWACLGAPREFLPQLANRVMLAEERTATACRWPTSRAARHESPPVQIYRTGGVSASRLAV